MREQAKRTAFRSLPFLLALLLYFTLHVLLRVTLSGTLDYDEAEQAMLAQWLLPGYTEQPPLYSWLQYGLFQLFGETVLAVSLLKNTLLFLTYLFTFLAAKEILKSERTAILATVSLLLLPQIGWESQRDMTHTTLVVCAAAATLWQGLLLLHQRSWLRYCLFGLTLAVGILSKSNYLVFLVVFLITLLSFPEGRAMIFSRKFGVALLVGIVSASPYLLWMTDHQQILLSTTHKFKQGREHYYLQGPLSLLRSSLLFLAPLLVFSLTLFPAIRKKQAVEVHDFGRHFIARYIVVLFLVVLIIVLLFQVGYVKDRWLQPLLFAFPIFLFSRLGDQQLTARRMKAYLGIVGIAAASVYLAFTLRVVAAEKLAKFCRLHFPIAAMARDISGTGFAGGLVISDNRFLAGNFSLALPDSMALIPGYNFESLAKQGDDAVILWLADNQPLPPKTLTDYLGQRFGIDLAALPIRYFEHLNLYAEHSSTKIGAIFVKRSTKLP